MGIGGLVDADEHQEGVEGKGCHGVGGHTMEVFAKTGCDDRDAGGEAAHCTPEIFLRPTHHDAL